MTDLITREVDLSAPIGEVWQALTDEAWLACWLADAVWLDLRPGGEARFEIGDTTRTGWVEEVAAPAGDAGGPVEARLAFWWAENGESASRVELSLQATGIGTRLRVMETRPLEVLDLVGVPLPGQGGRRFGPALVAA